MTRNRAIIELVFAGAFWGFGFVATVWGLQAFSPVQFLFLRFLIAWLVGELFYMFHFVKSEKSLWTQELQIGLPAGLLLGGALLLQTFGLKYTTATQSGFITTLYVIIVPLVQHLFFKKKQQPRIFLYALGALLGTYWLAGGSFEQVNEGDLLTLACSVFAALHIIYVGAVIHRTQSPFRFNTLQSFVIFVMLSALMMVNIKPFSWPQEALPWVGLFMTAIGSTVIAFTIQMRSQKILSPSTASMLFLLESPFALLFGFIFLTERFSVLQLVGAFIILLSSFLTVKAERP